MKKASLTIQVRVACADGFPSTRLADDEQHEGDDDCQHFAIAIAKNLQEFNFTKTQIMACAEHDAMVKYRLQVL
jgi:hypothetical protein